MDEERASITAKVFGIPRIYTHFDEMLEQEKPDLVDICTPPDAHAILLKQSLKMGYPCMVEKPLTTTIENADEVINLSRKQKLGVYVLHNYSYTPCIRKVKQIVANSKLGNVKIVETRYFTSLEKERYCDSNHWVHRLPGGILNSEVTPHLLMLLLDFLGDVKRVKISTLKMSNLPYVVADNLRIVLISENSVGFLGLSFNSTIPYHTLDLIGDKGCVFADLFTHTLAYHKIPSASTTHELSSNAFVRGAWAINDVCQRTFTLAATTVNVALKRYRMLAEGHRFLMRECFRSLRGEAKYPVDLQKCRQVVRLLEVLCLGESKGNGIRSL